MYIPQAALGLYWECVEGAVGFEHASREAFELEVERETKRRPRLTDWHARFTVLGRFAAERAQAHFGDELLEAAYCWKRSDADERLAICELLFQTLRFTFSSAETAEELIESSARDVRDQPVERIYPNRFSLKEGEAAMPNCFGKGLLLLGFAGLCKADVLGCTPIIAASEYSAFARLSAAEKLRAEALRLGIPIGDRLANYFRIIDAQVLIQKHRPPAFHQGALFRLDEERWCLIDPNAGFLGEIDNGPEVTRLFRDLKKAEGSNPGAIRILDRRTRSRDLISISAAEAEEVFDALSGLWTGPIETLADIHAALRRIGRKETLELLLSSRKIVRVEAVIEINDARYTGTTDFDEDAFARTFPASSRTEQREIAAALALLSARMGETSLDAFRTIFDWGSEEEAETDRIRLVVETLRDEIARLMNAVIGFGIDRGDVGLKRSTRRVLHPGLEVYLPDFIAGLWILAHTNGVVYRNPELHRFLGEFSSEEFLQLGIAAECLVHPEEYSREAVRTAVDSLRTHDVHSMRTIQQLERIERTLSEGKGSGTGKDGQ